MAKLTFGEKLADLREKKGITQKALAEVLGVNPRTIGAYESNRMKPLFDKLIAIGDYFHVSYDYLMVTDNYSQVVQMDCSQSYAAVDGKEYSVGELHGILQSFSGEDKPKAVQLLLLLQANPEIDIVGLAEIVNNIRER